MKRNVLGIILIIMQFMSLQACNRNEQKIDISCPQGKIACTITLPKDFNSVTDQVPMVILMHGIFANKDWVPIPFFAKGLAKAGNPYLSISAKSSENGNDDRTITN